MFSSKYTFDVSSQANDIDIKHFFAFSPPASPDEKLQQLEQRKAFLESIEQRVQSELALTQSQIAVEKQKQPVMTWGTATTDQERRAIIMAERKTRKKLRDNFQRMPANTSLPDMMTQEPYFHGIDPKTPAVPHCSAMVSMGAVLAQGYSQQVILHKINLFAKKVSADPVPTKGHCHGISILWLLLMRNYVENVFYYLIQDIVNCPEDTLLAHHEVITTCFHLIEVGQNTHKYFPGADYRSIDRVTGGDDFSAEERPFSLEELTALLLANATETVGICVTGWGYLYDVKTATWKHEGHTIPLICRDNFYYTRDPNEANLGALYYFSMASFVADLFASMYALGFVYTDKNMFTVQCVKLPELDASMLAKLSLFNRHFGLRKDVMGDAPLLNTPVGPLDLSIPPLKRQARLKRPS